MRRALNVAEKGRGLVRPNPLVGCVIVKDGIVVYIIYLMWVNKSVPTIAGARLVVSDNGDILSPK